MKSEKRGREIVTREVPKSGQASGGGGCLSLRGERESVHETGRCRGTRRLCLLFDKASPITSTCFAIAVAPLQLCGVPLQISRQWGGPGLPLQNALVCHSEPHTA